MSTLPEPNLEAQQGLIGCALLGATGDIMTAGITSASFTDAQCRQAWGIIETLVEIDEQINIVTIKGLSKHLTVEWLSSLEDMAPSASNWSYHVNLVKSAATSRALWELGNLTATAAAAGSIPYSSLRIPANSFTSFTVKFTNSSASAFKSAIFFVLKFN